MVETRGSSSLSKVTILPIAGKEDMIRSEAVIETLRGYAASPYNPKEYPDNFKKQIEEKLARIRDFLINSTKIPGGISDLMEEADDVWRDFFNPSAYDLQIEESDVEDVLDNVRLPLRQQKAKKQKPERILVDWTTV